MSDSVITTFIKCLMCSFEIKTRGKLSTKEWAEILRHGKAQDHPVEMESLMIRRSTIRPK